MFSAIQIPGGSGGADTYTSVGGGTRADYRFADRFSATLDVTASFLGGFANSQTAEFGTRFIPTPRGEAFRPYFDLRGAYTHINDTYVIPGSSDLSFGGPINQEFAQQRRYTGGLGGVAGAGFEYSVTNSLAFTTELTAMRAYMTTRRLTNPANNPGDMNYWMTSLRYTIGLKYNPVQALHLVQKATQ